jgi:hypothetical protein
MNEKGLFRCAYGGWHYLDKPCAACSTLNDPSKGDAMYKHLIEKALIAIEVEENRSKEKV